MTVKALMITAALLAVASAPASADSWIPTDARCTDTIRTIKGKEGLYACNAQIQSRQIRGGILEVCKIGQKCEFTGDLIMSEDGSYWETINARPIAQAPRHVASPALPQSITGAWCIDRDLTRDKHIALYRPERRACESDEIFLRSDGYNDRRANLRCRFQKVTQTATGWATITRCTNGGDFVESNRELYRLNKDGYLVIDVEFG
jgi:hypothetical protein